MAQKTMPKIILDPPFIDYFVEKLPDGRGLAADIFRALGGVEKRASEGGVISTHYSAPIIWYTATMELEGDNKVIELNLALQRGEEVVHLKESYVQRDRGIWRAIQKPASPLPQGFGPLSVESVMFESLLNKKNEYRQQAK